MHNKMLLAPCASIIHDNEKGCLNIELELPGVERKDIMLDMKKDSFCISAARGKDAEYSGCFWLAHEIVPEKAEAKYESGLLKIFAPIKDWKQNVNVSVQ